ncbi:MAG: shikimate dehydrogenase [Promethearchaeota archaeon]
MIEKNFFTSQTKVLCLIGNPIEHSMSPIMHNAAIFDLNLDYVYLAFKIKPENLRVAVKGIRTFNFIGINVTLPFKQKIMQYLDEIDPIAKKIGAINTIKNDEGYLTGKNTDADGGITALKNTGYKISGKNILLLGAGGAARALVYKMAEEANKIIIINRNLKRALKLSNNIRKNFGINIEAKKLSRNTVKNGCMKADIIINTTPIGMYPNIDESPIPIECLHEGLIVYDIIYNPIVTKLIRDANQKGCKTLGGLDMLVNQGALAFEWWTNEKPNIGLMKTKVVEFLETN